MVRMNITMPERVVQKLSKIKNKSRFIAEAVEEKIKNQEQRQLLAQLAQDYKAMAQENKAGMKDWSAIETEGWE